MGALAGSGVVPLIYTGISKTFGIIAGDQRVSFFRNNVHFERITTSGVKTQVANYAQPIVKEAAPVAVVTAASNGIGKAVALMLGKAGCKVLVNYSGSSKEAEEVSQEIAAVGGQPLAFEGDVSEREDVTSMIKTAVDAWGTIDVLVNCAGITKDGLLKLTKLGYQCPEVLDLNFPGLRGCTEEAVRVMMKKRHGRIINIVSVGNLDEDVGRHNYSAADGVIDFSKHLAKEYYNKGINVNVIILRSTASAMTDNQEEDFVETILKTILLERYSQFEAAALLVEFLAIYPECSHVMGQVFNFNGEW